ncbi:hypothetical protein JX266_000265 [Neoarthrinium moseri]|nr:hypothetical protein JX266_000265 [Neoarthrinium moseri]
MLQALGLTLTRSQLLDRASGLEEKLGATPWKQSLEDEGKYYEDGVSLEDTPFWCPKLAEILNDIETSVTLTNSAPSPLLARTNSIHDTGSPVPKCTPAGSLTRHGTNTGTLEELVVPLYQQELPTTGDEQNIDITATSAGYELAKYLRSRDFAVLHVLPQLSTILPDVGCWHTSILIKLMASLIHNALLIMPESISALSTASKALSEANFRRFESGDAESFEAGLEILASLPPLDISGRRKLVIIVDGLDTAESERTQDRVRKFEGVLRNLCTKQKAHLIYTLSDSLSMVGR